MANINKDYLNKEERAVEYIKCIKSVEYYAENYCEVFDQTRNGYVPYHLFDTQKELLKEYEKNRFNLVLKYRQAGISTTSALFIAHHVMFASKQSPKKVLIVANKLETAKEMLNKVKHFIGQAPQWMGINFPQNSAQRITLNNGSEVKAVASSEDALRGYTPTFLFIDEAAKLEKTGRALFDAAQPALATGGRAVLCSTPYGLDDLFYYVYNNSIKKENDYNVIQMYWFQDPRYIINHKTKKRDLVWRKNNREVVEYDREKQIKMFHDGWRPTSSWYEAMCRQLNGDKKAIAQELECKFFGSSGTFIPEETIIEQEINFVCDATVNEGFEGNVWRWSEDEKDPSKLVIEGDPYILGADVASGTYEDYSTIQIINLRTGNQVLEFQGKVPPDRLAEIIYHYAMIYNNPLVVVDSGGGYGITTLTTLRNLNYDNVYYSLPRAKHLEEQFSSYVRYDSYNQKKTPGFNTSAYRQLMLDKLELDLRNQTFKIKSRRLLEELKTFVWINGRPDHQRGYHDDLIFAFAMCIYVASTSYKSAESEKDFLYSMLNAVSTNVNVVKSETLNDITSSSSSNVLNEKQYKPKKTEEGDFMWLLG